MKYMTTLLVILTLLGCSSSKRDYMPRSSWPGYNWIIQYSYLQPKEDKSYNKILVQIHDDGRVHYIRHSDPRIDIYGNAAWWRKLKKTPKEVASVKKKIEAILAKAKDDRKDIKEKDREFNAHITIRTAKELEIIMSNKSLNTPHKQAREVFKNLRELSDETHIKIQEVLKEFNKEANKLPWKWG